jgi:copper(I)-binding protein
MAGGMMKMRAMPRGLVVAGSSTVRLQPEGYHLMLAGLRRPLAAGQKVRITLRFQRAGDVPADFTVRDTAP